MSLAEIILELFRVFLSWPVMILVLGLIFFCKFKDSISDFLRRVTKVGTPSVGIEATSPSKQREKAKENPPAKPLDEIETYIKDNPKEAIDNYLRVWNGYVFERTFNLIYGTQIGLIEHLSKKGDKGDKYINLINFYNDFVGRSGYASVQMAHYLGFLKDSGYITYEGEGSELSVKIMPYGIDFLSYIKQQYPSSYKNKPW